MDIPLHDNASMVPQPRETMRIEQLEAIVYPDRFRVFVHVQVTPFLERPNMLLAIHDENDQVVSELNIIETMHHDMEFTMHIRGVAEPEGVYNLTADLFYETRKTPVDRKIEAFFIAGKDDYTDRAAPPDRIMHYAPPRAFDEPFDDEPSDEQDDEG